MAVVSDLARALRRWRHGLAAWVRYACAVATLVTLAAPAALGAAMGPVLDQLGSMHEHVCKCGMAPGKCGCPACERAEQERLRDPAPTALPTLKGGCKDEAPALRFAALPSGAVPVAGVLLPAPRGARLPHSPTSASAFDRATDPPTPPPRLASV